MIKKKSDIKIGFIHTMIYNLKGVVEMTIASIIINLLTLSIPLVILQIYDRILPNNATSSLLWLVIGAGVAILFETVLKISRDVIGNKIGSAYEFKLSSHCFRSVIKSKQESMSSSYTNNVQSKLRLIETLRKTYCQQIYITLLDLPFAILFVIILYTLHPPQAYFILLVSLVLFVISYFAKNKCNSSHLNQECVLAKLT